MSNYVHFRLTRTSFQTFFTFTVFLFISHALLKILSSAYFICVSGKAAEAI